MPTITIYSQPENGIRPVKFWIRSNRGTDQSQTVNVPDDWKDNDIKYELEDWCSQFAAWTQSDCSYGWEKIKVPGKKSRPKKKKKS